MPTVAIVDGIKIQFYWDEHPPPHFHVEYAGHIAVINIQTLEILAGGLPKSQHRKLVAWAQTRRTKLHKAWTECQADANPGKIA